MKILLPVDGSEVALDAVRFAIRLAGEGLPLQCVLGNVQEPATLYEMVVAHDAEVLHKVSDAAAGHALAPAAALLRAAGIETESEVASGDAGHLLVEMAERFGCDMIVMSARGLGALRQALVGSVSQSVLHAARMPVLLVKAPPEPEAEPDELAEAAALDAEAAPG
jgi:nucleotide-binding universal stress UspA family protein